MSRARRLLVAGLLLVVAAPAAAVDLMGTWHVLIHYKDAGTEHAERERWEDRIWQFSMEGSKLKWVDYPIVVFSDQSGRFEASGMGRATRTLHFWEPNPGQLEQIQEGLDINPRGSRTKTLRDLGGGEFSSAKKSAYQSARFITYTETWAIEGLPDAPIFTFDDVMGSAATESFDGRTRYSAESVDAGGNVIRGSYDRDGKRTGSFRLTRAGATSVVAGRGESQGERAREAAFGGAAASLARGDLPGGLSEADLRAAIDAGTFGDEDREKLRRVLAESVEEGLRAQGNDTRQLRGQIRSLSRQMEVAFVDDGRSFAEIQRLIVSGEMVP